MTIIGYLHLFFNHYFIFCVSTMHYIELLGNKLNKENECIENANRLREHLKFEKENCKPERSLYDKKTKITPCLYC